MGGAAAAAVNQTQHRTTAAKVPGSKLSSSAVPSQFFLKALRGMLQTHMATSMPTNRKAYHLPKNLRFVAASDSKVICHAGGSYSRPAEAKDHVKAAQHKKQQMPDRFAKAAKFKCSHDRSNSQQVVNET
eukprot:gene7439-7648_t